MSYSIDLKLSAQRHFDAAEILYTTHRKDVAGYLYGLAAECAVKQLMRRSGIFPSNAGALRRDDPYYAHFPELKTCLRNHCRGRNAMILQQIVQNVSFMQKWDIKMRYAPQKDILSKDVDRWRGQAREVLNIMQES